MLWIFRYKHVRSFIIVLGVSLITQGAVYIFPLYETLMLITMGFIAVIILIVATVIESIVFMFKLEEQSK